MSNTFQTANKHWTLQEALLSMFGQGFRTILEMGGADPYRDVVSFGVVFVEDSGEQYYGEDRKFKGYDILFRELSDGSYLGHKVSLRVCIGQRQSSLYVPGEHTPRRLGNSPLEQTFLRCIGKATDGGPCIRIGVSNITQFIAAIT